MIHIQGMGWVGSILALNLERRGVDFTWHDTDARRVAWRASNGVVYPDGDAEAQACKTVWDGWAASGLLPSNIVAPALFAYSQKSPPHGGAYKPIELWPGVHSSPPGEAYIVNVAGAVEYARTRFADQRLDSAPTGSVTVVTHGSSERCGGYDWGWTARTRLKLPKAAKRAIEQVGGIQMYGRVNRFELAHATSIPGAPDRFKIGTSSQNSPKSRPDAALAQFAKRIQQVEKLFPGVKVLDAETPVEGWRPRNKRPDDTAPRWTPNSAEPRLVLAPAGHNGVRFAPRIVADTLAVLEAAKCVAPST